MDDLRSPDKVDRDKMSPGIVYGAASAGAVLGLILSGPLLAVGLGIAGAGAAITQGPGTVGGDIARSAGRLAQNSFDKAKELERKHDVIARVKGASRDGLDRVRALNDEHRIVDKTKAGAADLARRARELDEQHGVRDRAAKAILAGLDKANELLEGKDKKER
ncbi:hypothetical protein JKP88DRAFT_349633 [Tribonema minus]|uniref:Uncharacterized protein n=1 Tax=Tribonema minus TaxID=303371 RepID=A0A835YVL1_9STRA|nr:hypothetical protein JKP88DRAFT_349633 [Tribonema minus]